MYNNQFNNGYQQQYVPYTPNYLYTTYQNYPVQNAMQQAQTQQVQQPLSTNTTNIEYVNGIEGAKALPVPPSCKRIVLDSDTNRHFYIKSTDEEGKPSLKTFEYWEMDANGDRIGEKKVAYAKQEDVDYLKGEIEKLKANQYRRKENTEVKERYGKQ